MLEKDVIIREYEKKDTVQIKKLFLEFGKYFVGIDPLGLCVVKTGYAKHFFDGMIKNTAFKKGKIFVAENQRKIIGFIAGKVVEEKSVEAKAAKCGRILEFFIQESYRQKGIGRSLIKNMENYFRGQKCNLMRVEVFAPNTTAYQFYQKMGFLERNLDLLKRLS